MRRKALFSMLLIIAVVMCFTMGCNSTNSSNEQRKLLKGDWLLSEGQWHPAMRITHDSIFLMHQHSGIWTPLHSFGQSYRLTEDSLIFGKQTDKMDPWGLSKTLSGSWEIVKLTPDSLKVKFGTGLLQFIKIVKVDQYSKNEFAHDTLKQPQLTLEKDTLPDFLFEILPEYYKNRQYILPYDLEVPDSMVNFSSAYVPIKLNFNGDEIDDYLFVHEVNMYFAKGFLINGKNGEILPETSSFRKTSSNNHDDSPLFWHRGIDSKFKVVDVDSTDGLEDLAVMYRMVAPYGEAFTFQIFSLNKKHNYCDLIFEYEVFHESYTTDTTEILDAREYYIDVLSSKSIDLDTINIYRTDSHERIDEFPGISWENHHSEKIESFVYNKNERVYKSIQLPAIKP